MWYNGSALALWPPVPAPRLSHQCAGHVKIVFGHYLVAIILQVWAHVKGTNESMQRFGEKLRILRTRRGLTVRELAVALGYSISSHGYISETETGRRHPKIDFVLKVADYFGVTTDQLVRDDIELDAGVDNTS